MRKQSFIFVMLLCALLSGCARQTSPLSPVLTTDAAIPAVNTQAARPETTSATLWFRFTDEPCLAPESRTIETSPTMKYETALLAALVDGPASATDELSGLFPPGTEVLGTYITGRMLFVTLSREIMDAIPGEPANWQSSEAWAREVPLRRALAMQSIAATATENCDVDAVVILVEQSDAVTNSLRLRQSYYCDGSDGDALADLLYRDEAMLLTPNRAAEIVLQSWHERDFARLYKYVARDGRPDEAAFLADMAGLAHLTEVNCSGGSVDGRKAIFTLNGWYLVNGTEVALENVTLRLIREDGLWRIPLSELTMHKEVRQ